MADDRGNLSIDFLAGMTIFMLALIWVSTMIPGLLIGLQSRTIDHDAIAYRTGVILVEDPGMPANPPWENKNDFQKNEIDRFGLAASKDTPNILKLTKVERFFCTTSFSYPTDYQNRLIFGDRQYGFNITFSTFDGLYTRSIGVIKPDEYGYIRRLVKVKYPSNTTIDAQKYRNSANTSQHVFSIDLNCSELIGGTRDYAYQINPRQDQILINLTNLSGARVWHKLSTDNITLYSIDIYRRNPNPPYKYSKVVSYGNDNPKFQVYIDGGRLSTNIPARVSENITTLFSPGFFYGMADDFSLMRISYTFALSNPSGDNFFNNSFTTPYYYNYSQSQVTQPALKEGVLEVAVWAAPFGTYAPGLVTPSSTPLQPPLADFFAEPRTGIKPLDVYFTDISSGSPISWNWTFGDIGAGNTSKLQNPFHTYTADGTYTVNLTVTNAAGTNVMIKTYYIIVSVPPPVADFTANTTSGPAPLAVQFTDASTGAPTMWNWTFGDIGAGNTSIARNASHTYTKPGIYSVNLTVSNAGGNNSMVKTEYITVTPNPAWYDCSWPYRKNITTIRTRVSGSLTDFPILINFTSDADLAARAMSNGYDILFTASDGVTKLPHQIEQYTSSSGALHAWVKVPYLNSTANTTIFMYYGNSSSMNQQDRNNVWDTNYKGVWHLNETVTNEQTSGTHYDSTSNGYNGNQHNNGPGTGKIDGAQNFDGSGDYITIPHQSGLSATSQLTMETWVYLSNAANDQKVVGKTNIGTGYLLGVQSNHLYPEFWNSAGTRYTFQSGTVNNNQWTHLVVTWQTGGNLIGYVNGAQVNSISAGSSNIGTNTNNVIIAAAPWDVTAYLVTGLVDEVRISNIARSSDWIKTEYNNQYSPPTFYSVGSEEQWTCTGGGTPTPTPTPTGTATATPTPTPTPQPLAYVQGTSKVYGSGTTASGLKITLPGASTSGNTIVVSFVQEPTSLTVSSVTDSKGNTYTQAIGGTTVDSWGKLYTYYNSNIVGGSGTITVTVTRSGSSGYDVIYANEYAGVAASSPVDQTASAANNIAAIDSGAKTTTQANELIYGFATSDGTATPSSYLTTRSTADGHFIADRIVSATGPYKVNGTNSGGYWAVQMVTFKGS
jgi:PKD repeat protein